MALDLRQQLSKNFTLNEMIQSEAALRHGIDNTPTPQVVANLTALCVAVLQPVRNFYNRPVKVSSGYRSFAVNSVIGGSRSSDHCWGYAADFEIPGVPNYDVADYIRRNFKFKQLILEFYTSGVPDSGWVHVAYDPAALRGDVLTAARVAGDVVYTPGLAR
jgi:hypothetical protein